jgi:acetyl esterase/lipase
MSVLTEHHVRTWQPPATFPREQVIASSDAVLARPAGAVKETEDIFRLSALGLDWDIGVRVYEPQPAARIARGADGRGVGIFLLHGGAGDYKSLEKFALLFAEKFAFKVATMTFPGRLYLDDPSRDWPGDTINPDGSVRTPIWQKGEYVTPDQYEVVKDTAKRMKYGTRTSARAKPGTRFYDRMASWPVAFEEGMKEACRRHFPTGEFSIYVHGHSTGGPYVSMLSQRVANIAGVIAIENSTFGYINEKKHQWGGHVGKIEGYTAIAPKSTESWKDPFTDLYIRTWRDLARYRGSEALGQEGPQALMRLPWLMEEILEVWDIAKKRPQFKAEYMITHNIVGALEQAARAAAARLKMRSDETEQLVAHYLGYTRPLAGPGVKPVPPFLFVISKDSRDHSPEVYREVIIPMFQAMAPAPRVHVTRFGAGVHTYTKPEPGLPVGIAPAAAQLYHDAITGGFFTA